MKHSVALAATLLALLLLERAGAAPLLAWTEPILARERYPLLFALFFVVFLALRVAPRLRRPILLVYSLAAAACFDVRFAAFSLIYAALAHLVLGASTGRAWRWGFFALTFAGGIFLCKAGLFRELRASHPELAFFAYVFAVNYTFRLACLVHEARAVRTRLTDVVLYLMLGSYFVIVPFMLSIPRYSVFVRAIDEPSDSTRAGLRHLAIGMAASALTALVRTSCDPAALYAAFTQDRWELAMLGGALYNPVWHVIESIGPAFALSGLLMVHGFPVAPALEQPLRSESILDWWRRWNVHFRDLLVQIFFYPAVSRTLRFGRGVALAAGTASVFIAGSTLFHWLPSAMGDRPMHVPWSVLAENVMCFVAVTAALWMRQNGIAARLPGVPRPARIAFTLVLVFATTTGTRAVLHKLRARPEAVAFHAR
jgi:hypothetical protein